MRATDEMKHSAQFPQTLKWVHQVIKDRTLQRLSGEGNDKSTQVGITTAASLGQSSAWWGRDEEHAWGHA